MLLMNSKNWVAWTIEYGIPDVRIRASSTSFARKYPAVVFVEVTALGQLLRSDDRQGDVVADACGRFGDQQVVGRGREEVERGRVLEVGGVRDVDDDRGAVERRGEPFTGDRVDAEARRGRNSLVALLSELGDDLRADEPGATDDDDLHWLALHLPSGPCHRWRPPRVDVRAGAARRSSVKWTRSILRVVSGRDAWRRTSPSRDVHFGPSSRGGQD